MAVEIERLVVEEGQHALAFEFQRGLTVAFHENPAVRARFIADLVEALGPGRSGLHLELVDRANHRLAVFRPFGDRHRVVDVDRILDLSDEYAAPDHRVDLLGRVGLDQTTALRAMRLAPQQLERGLEADGENVRLVRALAALDQPGLWASADSVDDANARLGAAFDAVGGASIAQVHGIERLAEARRTTEWAEQEHRRISRMGFGIAGGCAVVGGILLALDGVLDDHNFTGGILLALSALALVLSFADRRHVAAARRDEAAEATALGIESFDALRDEAGPLADPAARRAVLDAADEVERTLGIWAELAGNASVAWARRQRPSIERSAERRSRLADLDSSGLLGTEHDTAEAARILIDKVIELGEVGVSRERLPLILDEPFVGMPLVEIGRLLETVWRLAQDQQVVLVTGDPYIQAWAGEAAARGVTMSRIGRASATRGAVTEAITPSPSLAS